MMRAAIVHYWLLNMRGGERVVESLCRLMPQADIFTLFYDPDRVSPEIRSRIVKTSFLNPARRIYRSLLPLAPLALESLDLRGYDLVVSSESGPAKGIVTSANTRHICYCHTPMRYLWDLYPGYLYDWTKSRMKRGLIAALAAPLRVWDFASAARVDEFIANSRNVQRRIWKAYRRHSDVVYPPVGVETFYWRPPADYYLAVSELVSYKRIDDAVRCFSKTGRRLRIVGDGPEYKALRHIAGPTVEFCGRVNATELRDLYAKCRALVMPGEEDFGMVAVEAMASGKPIVALGRGGALESFPENEPLAATFYDQPGEQALAEALNRFEAMDNLAPYQELQTWAARFSESRFAAEMSSRIYGTPADVETPVVPFRKAVNWISA